MQALYRAEPSRRGKRSLRASQNPTHLYRDPKHRPPPRQRPGQPRRPTNQPDAAEQPALVPRLPLAERCAVQQSKQDNSPQMHADAAESGRLVRGRYRPTEPDEPRHRGSPCPIRVHLCASVANFLACFPLRRTLPQGGPAAPRQPEPPAPVWIPPNRPGARGYPRPGGVAWRLRRSAARSPCTNSPNPGAARVPTRASGRPCGTGGKTHAPNHASHGTSSAQPPAHLAALPEAHAPILPIPAHQAPASARGEPVAAPHAPSATANRRKRPGGFRQQRRTTEPRQRIRVARGA